MPRTPPERPAHADKLFDERIEILVSAIFHAAAQCAENCMEVITSRLSC